MSKSPTPDLKQADLITLKMGNHIDLSKKESEVSEQMLSLEYEKAFSKRRSTIKSKLAKSFRYPKEELENVAGVSLDEDKDVIYLHFHQNYNDLSLDRIDDSTMRYGMRLLARALNVSTKPWAYMGSNAYLVEVAQSIVNSSDIDGMFDKDDLDPIYKELQKLADKKLINLSKPATLPSGTVVVSGEIIYEGHPVIDFEIFGQNTDPNKGPKEGYLNPGFQTYIIHRYRDNNTEEDLKINKSLPEFTSVNIFDRNAVIELYIVTFFSEFADFNYGEYSSNASLKLKHAKRLAKLSNIGISDFNQLYDAVKQYIPAESKEQLKRRSHFLDTLLDLWNRFQDVGRENQADKKVLGLNLSKEIVHRDGKEEEHHQRSAELEYAVEAMSKEAAKDIQIIDDINCTTKEEWRVQIVGKLIPEHKASTPLSHNDHAKLIELVANMDASRRLRYQHKIQALQIMLRERYRTIEQLQHKYDFYLEAIAPDEFNLFTIVDKVERLFLQNVKKLIKLYALEMDELLERLWNKGILDSSEKSNAKHPDAEEMELAEKALARY